MTTTTPTIVISPEVAVPADFVEQVRSVTELIQGSGLLAAAEGLYRTALPVYLDATAGTSDDVHEHVSTTTGWSDLHVACVVLASALLDAVGPNDLPQSKFLTAEDVERVGAGTGARSTASPS